MRVMSTRRTFLASSAAAAIPGYGAAEVTDRFIVPLRDVAEREFRSQRGGLALATVNGPALIYASSNAAVSETLWKPGSTVKPFLLRHLLERGLLQADEVFPCPGGALPFAGRRLDCSHAPQGGPLDPATALALSCNHCFLHWAARLERDPWGRKAFAETLRRAGFSLRQVFGRDCAAAEVRDPVSREEMLLQALGEADVLTTPLTLLKAYGEFLAPMRIANAASPIITVREGMRDCVRAGTGVEAQVKGLDLGGKTGTATSANRQSLNGWMLSFWPAAKPLYVLVVFVENGRGGAEAAPIAGAAWRSLQRARALL